MINFNNVEFIKSSVSPDAVISDGRKQIVFAGRSNVGKSSLINCLLNRKKMAYVGNTPGKTANINFFLIDKKIYFVDLPGYGFAKVSRGETERWSGLIDQYMKSGNVDLCIVIIDSRHNPQETDIQMVNFLKQTGIPFVVIANKIDKLKKSEKALNVEAIESCLGLEVIPFSCINGEGKKELIDIIINA